jgi:hypothetical protein
LVYVRKKSAMAGQVPLAQSGRPIWATANRRANRALSCVPAPGRMLPDAVGLAARRPPVSVGCTGLQGSRLTN